MKNIYRQLVQYLDKQDTPIKADNLAVVLNVSIRSIKNYISEINKIYPELISSSRNGYLLNKNNNVITKTNHQPQTSDERIKFIITTMIHDVDPIDIDDLADELFVSTSTLKNDLNKIKSRLKKYDLELVLENHHISIKGLEKNKRKLLSAILYSESDVNFVNLKVIQDTFTNIDIEYIKQTILITFEKYQYYINDYSLNNLILHISIAIDRIQNENINDITIANKDLDNQEYKMACEVVSNIEKSFNITYTKAEIYELSLLLISRATSIDYRTLDMDNLKNYIGDDCLNLVKELIQKVMAYYYIDLTQQEFYIRFALHIRNLLLRAQNNHFNKNPLAEGIKTSCPLIYDISVNIASTIKERTGISINDDEIAYIAFHLGSALQTQKSLHDKISAILYCPHYYDMNHKIVESINKNFNEEIIITNICTDENIIESIDNIDTIIATLPLSMNIDMASIQVSPFINQRDIMAIANHIEKIKLNKRKSSFKQNLELIIKEELFIINDDSLTKNQAIELMTNNLLNSGYVNEEYIDEIYQRESLSSTRFNLFAIPHSMKMNSNKTGISVLINKAPIDWDHKNINLVLMLAFNRNQRYIFNEVFEPITMILSEIDNVLKLNNCKSHHEFIAMMVEMLKE